MPDHSIRGARAPAPGLRYTLLALLFTFLWAAAFVAVKVGLYSSPPFFLMASRFLVAGVLLLAFGVTLVSFPFFWLARLPWLNVLGLAAAGLGVANLFPLAMTAAVSAAPDQPDAASARVSLALGASVLLAPFALGSLADRAGIRGAYAIVPPLLALAIGATWVTRRRLGR